ncbi:MAG: hypothetical protein JNM80_03210 [Phycisphaerae bacterium]|nr:hypothetical protein [Phycisphaerae bacterium]
MPMLLHRSSLIVAALAAHAHARPGPDVTLLDIQSISNHGAVGSIRAYSIGSHTCNIGNQNLLWLSNGTPGLAMNAYRLHDGRLVQLGMSWVKTACCAGAQSNPGCGTCNMQGGSLLGVGCLDVYSASWNSQQSRLAPRWAVNGYTGAFQSFAATSGDAIFKRLQIAQSDLTAANFPNALYFVEGVYVGTDDAANANAANNATYKRVTVDASFNLNLVANSQQTQIPAIRAWRDHGLGAGIPDVSVAIGQVTVPAEGQFWHACKARDLGNGLWRYDYAVFNLSSDRSGGSFSVPIPTGVTPTNIGFSAPLAHSGDITNNTPWSVSVANGAITWASAESFAQNANANAIRWGTMFNFWFDAPAAPISATATLGLFKPHTPSSVSFTIQAPGGGCYANCDASTVPPILNINDFTCFINRFATGDSYANCDGSSIPPILNINDYTCFLNAFSAGCN